MTETREWSEAPGKSEWKAGPWHNEPDKKQWSDAETGLPCLIVRGPVGALCGYVGVTKGHPFYGVGYSECPQGAACADRTEENLWCDHTPEHLLEVHGGVTFAGPCHTPSREAWEKMKGQVPKARAEASRYPVGDSARWLKRWEPLLDDYDAWVLHCQATNICHVPAEGEPDDVWWFGFDCSHAGDVAPGMPYDLERMGTPTGWNTIHEYRDIAYVEQNCAALARQLHRS